MRQGKFPFRLYLVTDEKACLGRDVVNVTEEAVRGGVDLVQLREKDVSYEVFLHRALRMKEMLDRYHVPLIINDNISIAVKSSAAGIHVGNSDMPPGDVRKVWPGNPMVGYSLEEETQVTGASAEKADYLGISPVFQTPTKTDTLTVWGLEGVRKIRLMTSKPLVAIGGIDEKNARSVMDAGADCLAVVSAICSAVNPVHAAERLRNEIEK